MGHTARKAASLVIAVALAASLAACGPAEDTADSGDGAATRTIKIGFAAPLTGDNAVYGQSMQKAVEMAIEEVNASADAEGAGFAFELRAEDDQADPKTAVNVANLLAGDDDVLAIFGHFNSGCTIPASKVYAEMGIGHVTVSSNPKVTEQGYDTVSRIVARDDAQGRYAAQMVYDELGLRTVVAADDGTEYGQGLRDQFITQFEGKAGKVASKDSFQETDSDFAAYITKIRQLSPEAVYYGGSYTQAATLAKQMKEAGLKVPVIGGDMLYTPDYIKLAGGTNAEGDYATVLGLPLENQPGGPEFAEKFEAKYDAAPQAYDSYAYDAARQIMFAVIAANPAGDDVKADREAVAKAIRENRVNGVTGPIEYDSKGDTLSQAISAYKVESGAWKLFGK